MKIADKPWKRAIIVITSPVWVFPFFLGILVCLIIGSFFSVIYNFIKYGEL